MKCLCIRLSAIMALAIGLMVGVQPALANNPGYWHDAAGNIWVDSHGHCWQTGTWTPDNAVAACEGGEPTPMAHDTDGDGVNDDRDACPNTPNGASVDGTGCALDRDRDGVADYKDNCPDSARGAKVDRMGCKVVMEKVDIDTDGDGIFDPADRCPHSAKGVRVNMQGCEVDSDGDGVVDSKDRCPNSAPGIVVNGNGCEVDSDGDGVVNSMDRCQGTPVNKPVDTVGCELKNVIVLEGVNFDTGSATLTGPSMSVLDRTAASLTKNPTLVVEVAGYTDNRGRDASNRRLSESRAVSVMNYLITKGVSPASLRAKGYGPDNPVASNDTTAGRAKNRRVELHLLKQ